MFPLALGAVVMTTLILTAFLVFKRRRYRGKAARKRAWLQQHGTAIVATVTEIQCKQAWRYGERWHRSTWNGNLEREKTWQSYYDVTTKWLHPATKRVYTFYWQTGLMRRLVLPAGESNDVFCSTCGSLSTMLSIFQLLRPLRLLQ
jgi:hypothetical protein